MFGRKAKELEEQLNQSQQEVAILAKKVETLSATLEEFKAKESAISGALTNAQRAAEKIIAEAENERAAILKVAEEARASAEQEAQEIVGDANREADTIVEKAKEKARGIAMQAEAFMVEYRANAARLNESLQAAATAAAAQAEQFRAFASGTQLQGETELAGEYADISALLDEKELELPDDYETPATLMKSIYAIENRDLPQQETGEKEEPAAAPAEDEPERVWTVNEIMKDMSSEPLSPEDAGITAELDAIINDVLRDS